KDVDSLVTHLLQGYGRKIATNLIPASFGHNPGLKPYPHDLEAAKKLMAEAGYAQGFSVDMYVPIGRYLMGKEAAEAVAGQFEKVGVKVRVRAVEWANLTKIMQRRWEPDAPPYWWYSCRLDTTLHAEGMYAGTITSDSTWGGFRDPEIDKTIEAARAETDEEQREKKYRDLDRILHAEKLPLVFLYNQDQIAAKKAKVDWKMRPDTLILISEAGWK
ncbi:MAG: ABC transporter substrate-binding protein, partial [Chloroflexota bacterium]